MKIFQYKNYLHLPDCNDNTVSTALVYLFFQVAIAPLLPVANHDVPEAMLEALLQAVVCRDTIGWRNESRKLILVVTDQGFHTAGDGIVSVFTKLILPTDVAYMHVIHYVISIYHH